MQVHFYRIPRCHLQQQQRVYVHAVTMTSTFAIAKPRPVEREMTITHPPECLQTSHRLAGRTLHHHW